MLDYHSTTHYTALVSPYSILLSWFVLPVCSYSCFIVLCIYYTYSSLLHLSLFLLIALYIHWFNYCIPSNSNVIESTWTITGLVLTQVYKENCFYCLMELSMTMQLSNSLIIYRSVWLDCCCWLCMINSVLPNSLLLHYILYWLITALPLPYRVNHNSRPSAISK